jgi:hypothetical protein
MAAVIVPLIVTAISAIGPEIPAIVQLVERLFGHSPATAPKEGEAKMQTAVSILTNILQTLANAGKIPSAPVVDPALPAGLAGAVQAVFDGLKASGTLGTVPAPVALPAAALAAPIAAAIQSVILGKGGAVLVTG